VEINSILAPVVAVGDQPETLASQRMVWMNYLKSIDGTVCMRCS
jgi:hypothetical protein